MRAQTLLYVVSLTLGYLPATFAAPSSDLAARHDHHHDHSNAGVDQLAAPDKVVEASSLAISPTPTLSGSSSSFTTPSDPSAHGHGNGHGHGHGHGSHHQPQVQLNETDVHHWHHFPPSYLAADFRLSKDQVIFGEELDESWTPEDEGGHRMLAFGHAGTFILAYFGILPIGESLLLRWWWVPKEWRGRNCRRRSSGFRLCPKINQISKVEAATFRSHHILMPHTRWLIMHLVTSIC